MVVCPACDKATRVKMGVNDKGEKVRLCKHCGASLDSGVKKVQEKKSPKTADKKLDEAKPKTEKVDAPKAEKKTSAKKAPAKSAEVEKADITEKSSNEKEVGGTNG